jgi:hypothetical protein
VDGAKYALIEIADSFNRLPIEGAYVLELFVDATIQVSLTFIEDPARVSVGSAIRRWDLKFNRISAVSLDLEQTNEHLQLEKRRAIEDKEDRPPSNGEAPGHRNIKFVLTFSDGSIEVTAPDYQFFVTQEIPMAEPMTSR